MPLWMILLTMELIENSKFTTEFRGLELTGHAGPSIGGLMVLEILTCTCW
jgi:hypothetical protein